MENETKDLLASEGDAEQFGVAKVSSVKEESVAGEPTKPKEDLVDENGFVPPPPTE